MVIITQKYTRQTESIRHTYSISICDTYRFSTWDSSGTHMSHVGAIWPCYMGVIWEISYVPRITLQSDSLIGFSYWARIAFTHGSHLTSIWHMCVSRDFVTWLPYRNLIHAPCRQALWHTYCILIFGTYRFHIWVPSETNMTHMCATWPCHVAVIWETHMCYILSTYLTQIYDRRRCTWPLLHGSHMENLICATCR